MADKPDFEKGVKVATALSSCPWDPAELGLAQGASSKQMREAAQGKAKGEIGKLLHLKPDFSTEEYERAFHKASPSVQKKVMHQIDVCAPVVAELERATLIHQAVESHQIPVSPSDWDDTGALNIPSIWNKDKPSVARVEGKREVGAGVVAQDDCTIVTANHVVDGKGSHPKVTLNGVDYTGVVDKVLPDVDLARIKLTGGPAACHAPELAKHNAQPGEVVVTIGNPYDLGQVISPGKVFATNLHPVPGNPQITSDMATVHVWPGNSGGPVFNASTGKWVGVMSNGGENPKTHTHHGGYKNVDAIREILKNDG